MNKPDDFSRKFFADIMKDRDPAYVTTIDLIEYGYQMALNDYRDCPEFFGVFDGRQVVVIDGPFENTVIWQEK